uniref:Response regulator n=1 Tax=Myoviridae sp. ctWb16 TaxID=2827690 RepID=A0A8S5T1F5_9CAUD|nr:MAG TPA: response regulator [Myoviridae sp. ctWb16]
MKILILDDEELYVTGLKELLKRFNIECDVDAYCDYLAVKNNVDFNMYDLIFITKTNKIDMQSLIKTITNRNTKSKIVIFISEYISSDVKTYMAFNVAGYISKKYSNDKIFNIINLIMLNENYFPNNLIMKSFNNIVTNKQIDVIKLINKGLSNKQIAYELNISESTVKVHITNILKRMNCFNRVQMINKAKELGIDLN